MPIITPFTPLCTVLLKFGEKIVAKQQRHLSYAKV
jgi:hypothetical protein